MPPVRWPAAPLRATRHQDFDCQRDRTGRVLAYAGLRLRMRDLLGLHG